MSSEIKPGMYAVEVTAKAHPLSTTTTPSPAAWLTSADFGTWRIPADCLRPLPPGMTADERAVVDAAEFVVDWRKGLWGRPIQESTPHARLVFAVDALRASRTPPDPVAELVAAVRHMESDCSPVCRTKEKATICVCRGRISAALAAVEAARGGK